MVEIEPSIVLSGFDPAHADRPTLNILLTGDHFSYAVFDDALSCQAFRSLLLKPFEVGGRQELVDIISADRILSGSFQSINVIVRSSKCALSPEDVSDDMIPEFLRLTGGGVHDLKYTCSKLDGQDVWLAWAMPRIHQDFFASRFGAAQFHHTGEVLAAAIDFPITKRQMCINLSGESMEVVAADNRKLKLHNSYTFRTAEDFLYFCSLAYEQIGFDTNADQLLLIGEIEHNSKIMELARKYVRHVTLAQRPAGLQFNERFSNIPPQRHFVLFASVLLAKVSA